MELQRFGKLLLELSELSADERSIIFIQLAKDFGFCVDGKKNKPAASEQATKPKNYGKPIADDERHEFTRYAHACLRGPLRKRSQVYNHAAKEMGRSYDSVRCEILRAIKKINSPTATQTEAAQ